MICQSTTLFSDPTPQSSQPLPRGRYHTTCVDNVSLNDENDLIGVVILITVDFRYAFIPTPNGFVFLIALSLN